MIPLSGLHKFYLGQPLWGIFYLLLCWTPIPHVASAIEGFWYLVQNGDEFDRNFNRLTEVNGQPAVDPKQIQAIADALRELEQLRQEGLISDYEFEQKRRQLLDRMV